ncbi:MAG: nickel insertion protein, partial [Pirellulaceae bacterium]
SYPAEHIHRNLQDLLGMIGRGDLNLEARALAEAIFQRIAEAEARVHGVGLEKVHFHEVGAIDSIADIVGFAVAWTSLGVRAVYASPLPLGTGSVRIAHGIVSLPAPATAEILRGI